MDTVLVRLGWMGWVLLMGLLLGGNAASAEETLTTYVPYPSTDYYDLQVNNDLAIGSISTNQMIVNGNMSATGDVMISGADMTVLIGPDFGPYGTTDSLRVMTGGGGCVTVGDPGANCSAGGGLAKLKAFTAIRGSRLYTKPNGTAYAFATAVIDDPSNVCITGASTNYSDGSRRSYLGAKILTGGSTVPDLDADLLYGPMRLESRIIELGDWRRHDLVPTSPLVNCDPAPESNFKWCSTPYLGDPVHPEWGDTINGVLVGTTVFDDPDGDPEGDPDRAVLQIGDNPSVKACLGDFQAWSSREFKKDISALTQVDTDRLLQDAAQTDVFFYRLKTDPAQRHRRIGLIAEEAPKEFSTGKTIGLVKAAAFLTATMKALKSEQDALKKRLDALEQRRAARQAVAMIKTNSR